MLTDNSKFLWRLYVSRYFLTQSTVLPGTNVLSFQASRQRAALSFYGPTCLRLDNLLEFYRSVLFTLTENILGHLFLCFRYIWPSYNCTAILWCNLYQFTLEHHLNIKDLGFVTERPTTQSLDIFWQFNLCL